MVTGRRRLLLVTPELITALVAYEIQRQPIRRCATCLSQVLVLTDGYYACPICEELDDAR